jgi:CRISPR-associated protein Cmr4
METKLLFFYTETPLHAGTGSSVSVVDLPIQRERATQYPMVQGSGIKGALRSQADMSPDEIAVVFGPETATASDHAGAISVGDARIALFPVRSLVGVFAYATSVPVINRLARDAGGSFALPMLDTSEALVTSQSRLTAGGKVVLEEYSFNAKADPAVDEAAVWLHENAFPAGGEYAYWRERLMTHLVILPEDSFRDFTVSSTEIRTHIRLDKATKTVADGALWTSESVPSDALFYAPVTFRKSRKKDDLRDVGDIMQLTAEKLPPRIQLGGDETTGQGIAALRWVLITGD